jgi:hypothetical protein
VSMSRLLKNKRDRLLMVAIGTAGLLIAMYFFVVSAQKETLRDYSVKLSAAEDKLNKANVWLRMAANIEAQLEAQRSELDARHAGLAPADRFKWFYDTMESFLAGHKVHLVDISREPEIGPAFLLPNYPYQAATFGVKCRALYHDFGVFLADLENRYPYMRVQNIEVEPENVRGITRDSRGGAQSTPQALNITLRVVTLIRPKGT